MKTSVLSRFITGLLIAACLLTGCSGIRTYPNTLNKNLHIRTETESGSIFSKVRAALHIYRVDSDCRTEYEGTVKLDKPLIDVGIPSDKSSYMVFSFSSSSFLANSRSSISYDTLLKPRNGYSYDIKVSYIDNIYNAAVHEIHPRKSTSLEIDRKDLSACNTL